MKNKKGFTLLEVITAISVIAIISGPLLYLFVTSTRVGRNSYDADKANTVAVALVEEIKASPGGWLSKGYIKEEDGAFTKYTYYDNDWEPTTEAYATFRAKTTVEETAAGGSVSASPYLPQMGLSDGTRYIEFRGMRATEGNTFRLICRMTEAGGVYMYTIGTDSGHPVLRARPTASNYGSFVTIESALPLRAIPIVVISEDGNPVQITFGSDNTTSAELTLFVYGDPSGEYVTVSDSKDDMISGVVSVTYMQTPAETLENNKANVAVTVERMDGSSNLATYTSLVYMPA